MAKLSLVKGTTSYSAYVFVQDSSVSTGVGLTGLVYNSASLVASYVRPRAARVAITLATQTVTGAYSSGGFVEVDATNMPGVYRLDVPDAALATGVDAAVIMLKGAANMVPVVMEVELTAVNNQDAAAFGLSRLDATVSSRLATSGYTAPPTAAQNATELLDQAAGVETNRTVRQALRLMLAALGGKLSGAATATVAIRDTNDSKNRITASVDADGNRTSVSYDAS